MTNQHLSVSLSYPTKINKEVRTIDIFDNNYYIDQFITLNESVRNPSIFISVSNGDQFITDVSFKSIFDEQYPYNDNEAILLGNINGNYITPYRDTASKFELKLYFKCVKKAKNLYLFSASLPPLKQQV